MTVREVLVRADWPVGNAVINGLDDPLEDAIEFLDITANGVGWDLHQYLVVRR